MTIKLQGYRRFETPSTLDVAGDVVALVGPNEAGKTGILSAMLALNHTEDFRPHERTRGGQSTTSVTAGYVLDDADRQVLTDIPGGSSIRWWTLEKQGERRYYRLHPAPRRDLETRHETAVRLQQFAADEDLHRWTTIANVTVAPLYRQALAALQSTADDLDTSQVRAIRSLAETLPRAGVGTKGEGFSPEFHAWLEELKGYDEGESPATRAAEILIARRPRFVLFEDRDRELRSTYDLGQEADNPSPALGNLARLAGLDLNALVQAIRNGDGALRLKLLHDANVALAAAFETSWRQSKISVHLHADAMVLEVYASMPDPKDFIAIEERSAGMLWFVALRAFLGTRHFDVPPILLVDEAETHLHYDAQADIVRLFSEQSLAAKVIYTTHSAGCLPQDLGTGIRVVSPIGPERSEVRKSVWLNHEAGFTPLIYAMGATTFAFLPARFVVIVEGPTDAMLYPTLFREATGQRILDFQVAPGLSVVEPASLFGLTSEGGTVVFLTDGDAAGALIRERLVTYRIPKKRIHGLDQFYGAGLEIEDLIEPCHYVAAANRVLRDFQRPKAPFTMSDIPGNGRVDALERWCIQHGLKTPDKRTIAQQLLDMKSDAARQGEELRLLATIRERGLLRLYSKIQAGFSSSPKIQPTRSGKRAPSRR